MPNMNKQEILALTGEQIALGPGAAFMVSGYESSTKGFPLFLEDGQEADAFRGILTTSCGTMSEIIVSGGAISRWVALAKEASRMDIQKAAVPS